MRAFIPLNVIVVAPDHYADQLVFRLLSEFDPGGVIHQITEVTRDGMVIEAHPRVCMAIIDLYEPFQDVNVKGKK